MYDIILIDINSQLFTSISFNKRHIKCSVIENFKNKFN